MAQSVARSKKLAEPSSSAAFCRTSATSASGGPRRQAATMAATASAWPMINASTLPSRRLRTQPRRLRCIASCTAQARKPTPWTRPIIDRRNAVTAARMAAIYSRAPPLSTPAAVTNSFEFEDELIDRKAVAWLGGDARNPAVALGAQYVLHLHRLDDGQRLARFDVLTGFDGNRHQKTRHRRQQVARLLRRRLGFQTAQEGCGVARHDHRFERRAATR